MSEPIIGPPHCRRCGGASEDYILQGGLCGYCEAAAIDAGEPAAPASAEELVEYAATLYGITYPPGPLRTAAVVGAMLSRGLDAAACSALAVEQMGAALEARKREAARLALRGEDPSAELLAARLDADRLRAGLRAARRAMVREVRELRHPDAGSREYDSAHRLELAREAVDAVLLPTPSLAGEG